MKNKLRAGRLLLLCSLILTLLTACSGGPVSSFSPASSAPSSGPTVQGAVYLYGEIHADKGILARELELWQQHYEEEGLRHLFVEQPFYTAQLLNLWMQTEDDQILDRIYQNWAGTRSYSPSVKEFYQAIKAQCPETVFHGTDVGHQYDTIGAWYLQLLEEQGLTDSEEYQTAQTVILQGQTYYRKQDDAYRENTMTENFLRELDALGGASVMGIYGAAHTDPDGTAYSSDAVPCMAAQLKEHLGDALYTEDLSCYIEPLREEILSLNGADYRALYFGRQDLTGVLDGSYLCRDFWRLEDAYDDFSGCPKNGNVLPQSNYPMPIADGQVFVIDYTLTDGTVLRQLHRTDGLEWQGQPASEEFTPD